MRSPATTTRRRRFRHRGIVLIEVLLAVGVVVVTVSVAYQQMTGVIARGDDSSRNETVKMLNSAVSVYLKNGGTIPPGTTGDAMLAKMKKIAAEDTPGTFAGFRGPFIDVRLKGKTADSQSSAPRIVWNISRQQFTLASEGTGWSDLYPDQQEAVADHGTEVRQCMLNFASENQWVWDYADTGAGRRGAARVPTASPLVGQPDLVDDLISLTAPVITPASGTFNHHAFPLSLSIADANASGVSDIMYQVNGGAWLVWQGGQSPLQKSLTTTVSAFAQAREMSAYSDSNIVTETYISYFLRGQGTGTFLNPAGDNQFLYSLNPGGSIFSWGKAEASGQSVSSLEMIPATTFEAGDGESFTAGSLRYTNGVTRAGTNARTATLRLDLAMSVPAAGTVSMNLPVRMLNSIHYPWTPDGEKVDYLWVPQYSTLSVPIPVLNRHFTVTVLAQAPSAVVEGSDIKLTIAENASADVTFSATVSALD